METTAVNPDSVSGPENNTTDASLGPNTQNGSPRSGTIECTPRFKHPIGDQADKEQVGPSEGSTNSTEGFSSPERSPEGEDREPRRHLPEKTGTERIVASTVENPRSPRRVKIIQEGPKFTSSLKFYSEIKKESQCFHSSVAHEELRRQNHHLMEALAKIQKTHATEKKRFNETLMGIDKALSSLPIRLEKIRVRNQRNLCIINSSKFYSGDGTENATETSGCESSRSDDSTTAASLDSEVGYVSSRMKSLLQKMDQLNDLINNINDGDTSPIELLVNSELYAISLLKKEIKTTKRQIEDNKSDSETVTSYEGHRIHKKLTEDSCSKAKNSFSNELHKASNFKIFENHMMLQEEALNLLTRKIKETEEALVKEVEAKEGLKRENEAMAKEIFRLKSPGEESKGEKFLKTEKLKPEPEATGNRPYKLIKELKTKLEEKEKALIASKSKCTRLESVSVNKSSLLDAEKKKNFELETTVRNLKTQNKSLTANLTSLQYINQQLKDQMEILKQQVEILANEKLEQESKLALKSSKLGEQMNELTGLVKSQEEKAKHVEKEANKKIQEMKSNYETEFLEMELQLNKYMEKNDEFYQTFKELLIFVNNFGMAADIKDIRGPSYKRIREILQISASELEILFSVYAKSAAENEVQRLFKEFQSIINEETEFSETLSTWFFQIIIEKLLQGNTDDPNYFFDN